MRASLTAIAAILLVVSALFIGCDRQEASEPSDEKAAEQKGEDVVIYGGGLKLTLEEVNQQVERMRLLAPGVAQGELPDGDPDWMKAPHVQIDLIRNLARFHIVRRAAEERGLEITAAEETSFLAEHEPLKRYLPLLQNGEDADALGDELDAVGLSIDDVRHLIHDMILTEKLTQALAEEFSDEELWAIYQQAHDEADIIAVRLHNTPASHEIDRALDQYDAEIRAFYREHRNRYRIPPQVITTILKADSDDENPPLEEAAEQLGEGDRDPADIASDFGLTLEAELSVTRHENPAAHQSEVGAIGVLWESRRGPYAWRVEQKTEAQPRSLDRPLRREIASRVLREQEGITPSNRQRAQRAREILAEPDADQPLSESMQADLIERLEEAGFEVIHTGLFSLQGSEVIPEIGLAENVVEALQKRDLDDPVTDPILDRNAVYVARIVERNHPDREQFDEERDAFREQFLERNRHRLVDNYVRKYQRDEGVEFNTRPLVEHYGPYKKPENLQTPPSAGDPPSAVDDDEGAPQ